MARWQGPRLCFEAMGRNVQALWDAGPTENAKSKRRVAKSLLQKSPRVLVDAREWDWARGRFFLTQGSSRSSRRLLLDKVHFVATDIEKVAKSLNTKQGAGARPTQTAAWTEFWMEIVRMALAGELTKAAQINREKFRHDLFHRLGWDDTRSHKKPPLAVDTLKPAAGKVWDRFIERPKA